MSSQSNNNASPVKPKIVGQIEVIGGANVGAVESIGSGDITIGSSENDDFILFDDKVEDGHITLSATPGLLGASFRIKVSGKTGVVLENGGAIKNDDIRTISIPNTLKLGNTEILLSGNSKIPVLTDKIKLRAGLPRPAVGLTFVLLFLFGGAGVGYSVISGNDEKSYSEMASNYVASSIEENSEMMAGEYEESEDINNIKLFYKALNRFDLGNNIILVKEEDGSIIAKANREVFNQPAWLSFMQWYDSQISAPVLRQEADERSLAKGLPKIKYISFNPTPSLILDSNKNVKVGDIVGDNWEIHEISRDKGLVLKRAEETVRIKL